MMIFDFMEKNNINSKRIYFLGFSYAVGGGDVFFFRLIEYILKYTNRKVGIIDFSDGILTRTGKKLFSEEDIHYIPFESSNWDIEDNSCIFTPAERIGYIKEISNKNTKILVYHWNTDVAWNVLFNMKTFYKLSNIINKNNACAFMDYGCYIYACKASKQIFKKQYIPLFFYSEHTTKCKRINHDDEINIVWLGRLSTSKVESIKNVIENFSMYQTNKKKKFHIIGNGIDEDSLKKYCEDFKDIEFIFTGVLVGEERDVYMQKNADVGFAMGTSLLNFASLSIPVVAVQEPRGSFHTDQFQWLFNLYEYCLGSPLEHGEEFEPMFKNISNFNKIIDDIIIYGKYEEYGKKCFEYYNIKHNDIKSVGKKFIYCIDSTKLTYNKLKKCLNYLPYDSYHGIYIKKYCILGIPLLKIVTHINKTYYFIGIKVGYKISSANYEKMKMLGIFSIRHNVYGNYMMPSITSNEVKNQCKDKYSIYKRMFVD